MEPLSVETLRSRVDDVIRRGRTLRRTLAADPTDRFAAADTRIWQHDCEAVVNVLSGGSKAHWLARAYSDALLVRSSGGRAVERADLTIIVDRIIDVLGRAVQALTQLREPDRPPGAVDEPAPRRFDFVHNRDLRPMLEQAYAESRQALDDRRFGDALMASCGILEAIITDALEHRDPGATRAIVASSFDARIAAAERAGLIRSGCARLPAIARAYRDSVRDGAPGPGADVGEGDARVTGQVLHVVMRDLDPGR